MVLLKPKNREAGAGCGTRPSQRAMVPTGATFESDWVAGLKEKINPNEICSRPVAIGSSCRIVGM